MDTQTCYEKESAQTKRDYMGQTNAVSVASLYEQFGRVDELSPAGFEAAINALDHQSIDGWVDADEVFDVFGVEQSCKELTQRLGTTSYSRLIPQTMYYPECPLEQPEPATCSYDEELGPDDAQVGLDLLKSLGAYLQKERAVIQEGEAALLHPYCTISREAIQRTALRVQTFPLEASASPAACQNAETDEVEVVFDSDMVEDEEAMEIFYQIIDYTADPKVDPEEKRRMVSEAMLGDPDVFRSFLLHGALGDVEGFSMKVTVTDPEEKK